jgi:tetratricopeptide (TPR) repeat protein
LAATLDGLPLALEQAGAYVAATGTVSLAGYAELFETWAPELLRRGQPLGYQHTVATTWSLTLQALRETDPPAADLLTLASFLAPDDLPLPLITTHHEQLPEPLTAMAGEPLGLADAVAALRRYSLIRIVADGVYVHRLLQTVIRTALEAHDERAWAATAVRLLRSAFPHRSDDVATWPECERLLPHVLAAVDHGQSLDVEAEAWLSLLHEAAVYLHRRGRYRQALDLHQQVLAVRRRTLGDDHPDTLASMNKLAESRWILGDPHGARELHEQTLAARRRVLGDDHRDTLDSMNNLALDHQALGDLHGARDLHQQALAARRQLLGDDHPHTLASMNNLAETLAELGDLQGAHDLHEQTLAAGRRLHGDDHRYVLISLNNLADVRRALGDLQGARDLHEQALAARRRVLGDDHPHTLQSMNNLADVRRALGDLDGARQLHEQALTGYRRVLGEDHPDTLLSMNNLAEVCRELGEL